MPEWEEREYCVNCKEAVFFNFTVKDEWTHSYGGTYCRDRNGFTATPLTVATPPYHGKNDFL